MLRQRRKRQGASSNSLNVFTTKTPHSIATFLVDGKVAGIWRYEQGEVQLELSLAARRVDIA
jgi:hypothetical protein